MNFKDFYSKTENRLSDAILSLWATGDKEMQDYFKFLLSEEPIMAEAVFQNTFPWEQGELTFAQTSNLFKQEFIDALDNIEDEDFQFPKDRYPYKHQLKSWDTLLNQKKSIAVTTGTGSGKTECFMLPVINDIYENAKNQNGINAIFLYPLNALISSQRKRMHAWCSALDGVKYALLTGDTPNKENSIDKKNRALPELISRDQIREQPPQILFTNPTMLEYMLVRNADVPIVEKSKGSLRWILLDEAHTLTGSKAAEMALLIKRVISAFEVNIDDIRFAITSATVGKGNKDALKKFMSDLCGVSKDQIEIISGKRVNNQIDDNDIPNVSETLTSNHIKLLRDKFLEKDAISQGEIGKYLNISNKLIQLETIDTLADQKVNGNNLLPVRGHFFTRGIGGVYTCTNKNCNKHKDNKPEKALGTMYTIAGKKCSCGFPLLELVACRSCGNMMLEGEKTKKKITQKTSLGYEAFSVEDENTNDENDEVSHNKNVVRLILNKNASHLTNQNLYSCNITQNNDVIDGDDYLITNEDNCPHCGNLNNNPIHFRISSAFTNRILSDIVLDQTEKRKEQTKKTLYKGRKYISFTDSRQGTAKISALINIDSERDWIRYQVYHFLLKKLKANKIDSSRDELLTERAKLVVELENTLPFRKSRIQEDINLIDSALSQNDEDSNLLTSRASWREIIDHIKEKNDFKVLFRKSARGNDLAIENETYAKALLYDQFARRIPRERSLENLGLVNIIYPALDNIILPKIAEKLNISKDEWLSLLKIAVDFIIRSNSHFSFDEGILKFSSKRYFPSLIYSSNSEIINVKKWVNYNTTSITQSKLVLLICAGLGWHDRESITVERRDLINELLEKIWRILQQKVLTSDDGGFRLDFLESTQFEIAGKEYLCPVTNRLIDKIFKGYSPLIKGNLDPDNIRNYKINNDKNYRFPTYSYPYHKDENDEPVSEKKVEEWLNKNSLGARDKGLWNNLHERIFDYDKLYLAGEHSAQQSKKRLKELEAQFETGEINILSCSTTMEMGVDIGGISAVVMSNVPPMPANYLQRTGRAGRRSENKSLALTFCAPNPIGLRTMNNPKWALEHKIAPPSLSFDSKNIVIRHANSLLFGVFIRHEINDNRGLNIKESVEKFFYDGSPTIGESFSKWLDTLNESQLEEQLQYLVKGTTLSNASTSELVAMVVDNFEVIITKVREQKQGFENKLEELKNQFGDSSPAYKAVNYRKGQFLQSFVLNYLAEENFLPNAGLPTGIVDFENITIGDLKRNNTRFKSNPSYPISRALTEFAPGNSILIDGLNYKSSGIVMKNNWGRTSERNVIQGCKNCGFQRRVNLEESVGDDCPKCNSSGSFRGLDLGSSNKTYTELIEPAGFSIDLFDTPSRVVSERSKPQYLEPLLLNVEPWSNHQNNFIDFRTSSSEGETEILFYNTGDGEGYSLCLDCGRVETSNELLEDHKRLRGGRDNNGDSICTAKNIRESIILGSRFNTDFTEIRLKNIDQSFVDDKKLAYSLGVIITKSLAEYLAIEEAELGFGIKKYKGYQTIFIYDTAKGGAGYSSQFNLYVDKVLKLALDVLGNCDCQTACTKCLIDRNTQWHIEDLDRNEALSWLRSALENKLPEKLEPQKDNVSLVYGEITDEIKRQIYHYGISEINIHVNHKVSCWETDKINWLNQLLRNKIKINLVIEGNVVLANNQEKLSLHILSNDFNLKSGNSQSLIDYPVHLSIKLQNGKSLNYISKADYDNLSQEWNFNIKVKFYKVENLEFKDYEPFILPELDSSKLYESRIKNIPFNSYSNDISKYMMDGLNNSDDFLSKVKNQKFDVAYYDKYNQSEFSLRLMLQFIEQLKKLCEFEVSDFNVHLCDSDFKSSQSPNYIIHNYQLLDHYLDDLEQISGSYDFDIGSKNERRLPHYRYFSFTSDKIKFNIRIDAGIAHGFKPIKYLIPSEMKNEKQIFKIRKDVNYDIIYNINIE